MCYNSSRMEPNTNIRHSWSYRSMTIFVTQLFCHLNIIVVLEIINKLFVELHMDLTSTQTHYSIYFILRRPKLKLLIWNIDFTINRSGITIILTLYFVRCHSLFKSFRCRIFLTRCGKNTSLLPQLILHNLIQGIEFWWVIEHGFKFIVDICWKLRSEFAITKPHPEKMARLWRAFGIATTSMLMVKIVDPVKLSIWIPCRVVMGLPLYISDFEFSLETILLCSPLPPAKSLAFFKCQSRVF